VKEYGSNGEMQDGSFYRLFADKKHPFVYKEVHYLLDGQEVKYFNSMTSFETTDEEAFKRHIFEVLKRKERLSKQEDLF